MTHSNPFKAAATALLLLATGASQAALTVYTTQASFAAALAGTVTDSFDNLAFPIDVVTGPAARTVGSYSYTASALNGDGQSNDLYSAGSEADRWLTTYYVNSTLRFDGLSAGVNGIGGYFFGSDDSGAFVAGQTIKVTAADATGSTSYVLGNATTASFIGFVSTGPMTSLEVGVEQGSGTPSFVTANNLTLGVVAVVPEPEIVELMLAGLGLVGAAAARRRVPHR